MVEPVSLNSSGGQPPKPFFESPVLFCAIEAITLVATREIYKSINSTTVSLITFIMGTGFAIKPYTVWSGFIAFLNSLPESPTYIRDDSPQRSRKPRRDRNVFIRHSEQQPPRTQVPATVFTNGRRAVPKSQQNQQSPQTQVPATAFTNGRRAVPKSQQNQQSPQTQVPTTVFTNGRRAVPKSQQSQQPPQTQVPATVFTNGERAKSKKKT